jgi:hypothetical protein
MIRDELMTAMNGGVCAGVSIPCRLTGSKIRKDCASALLPRLTTIRFQDGFWERFIGYLIIAMNHRTHCSQWEEFCVKKLVLI